MVSLGKLYVFIISESAFHFLQVISSGLCIITLWDLIWIGWNEGTIHCTIIVQWQTLPFGRSELTGKEDHCKGSV